MIRGPWHITDTALREFAAICGEPADVALAERLRALLPAAKFKRTFNLGFDPLRPCQSWQVRVVCAGKSRRLNLTVSLAQSAGGLADQLVAVEDNDARRQWRRR